MRLRKGQIVCIEFVDHVRDASIPLPFAVYGRLSQITPKALSVDCWCHQNPTLPHDDNVERYTIVRAAITKITRLVEAE